MAYDIKSMDVELETTLFRHLRRFSGFSLVNFGRVMHTIPMEGTQLLKMFSFIKNNTDKNISQIQRNTQVRFEDGVPHVSGPASQRPLPQTVFHATWRRNEKKLALEDGNTRVLAALLKSGMEFFEHVQLVIYEVADATEAESIYRCFDSRQAVKQGKHDVQSLFRAADVLENLSSRRMLRAGSVVTPLKILTKKSQFRSMTPKDIHAYLSTLVFADQVLLGLEGAESTVRSTEFTAVMGGGELTGIMLFHSENEHNPVVTPYLSVIQRAVLNTLSNRITRATARTDFDRHFDAYLADSDHLGRSGSKVVPERAALFKKALEQFAFAVAATHAKGKSKSKLKKV